MFRQTNSANGASGSTFLSASIMLPRYFDAMPLRQIPPFSGRLILIRSMPLLVIAITLISTFSLPIQDCGAADGGSSYHSDSDARYLHQIHLYDAENRRIEPGSTKPYSTKNTCGRCHDYETISHGWHFNAFSSHETEDGRAGEPWIWTDVRTGTQLPLSYRDWADRFDPRKINIDQWDMLRQFGGRMPGGGLGHAPELDKPELTKPELDKESAEKASKDEPINPRWAFSGSLQIDCLACHGVSGSYDFNARREQITDENFAWAATAAMKLGTIQGSVSRIKDDADPEDPKTIERLPKVSYDESRFASDGTVFVDLIRQPENNSCYQCHSNRTIAKADSGGSGGIEPRWIHDEDVHLRAGMQCTDCHRNGIDHHIVRGFPGEDHPSDRPMTTLSCAGCHMGESFANEIHDGDSEHTITGHDATTSLAGRMGSPLPEHAGLPPLHFEKMSCTACRGGPLPRDEALGIMTSLAHSLGEKGHRTGEELPQIAGPVYARGEDGRVYPHRVVWPAYWGILSSASGDIEPIDPNQVYEITRKALRVRKDFVEEVLRPKPKSETLKAILGETRARADREEWSAEEAVRIDAAIDEAGRELFGEKVTAAIAALQESLLDETSVLQQVVYVSSGFVYGAGEEPNTLQKIAVQNDSSTKMVRWPMAHNVRPAGWSLGITGCTECHSESGKMFASTVVAKGPGPDDGPPISMATIQGVDADQRLAWNQLFSSRANFKYVIATSVGVLVLTLLLGLVFVLSAAWRQPAES